MKVVLIPGHKHPKLYTFVLELIFTCAAYAGADLFESLVNICAAKAVRALKFRSPFFKFPEERLVFLSRLTARFQPELTKPGSALQRSENSGLVSAGPVLTPCI